MNNAAEKPCTDVTLQRKSGSETQLFSVSLHFPVFEGVRSLSLCTETRLWKSDATMMKFSSKYFCCCSLSRSIIKLHGLCGLIRTSNFSTSLWLHLLTFNIKNNWWAWKCSHFRNTYVFHILLTLVLKA